MLTEICAELRNWFVVPGGIHIQTYTISAAEAGGAGGGA